MEKDKAILSRKITGYILRDFWSWKMAKKYFFQLPHCVVTSCVKGDSCKGKTKAKKMVTDE